MQKGEALKKELIKRVIKRSPRKINQKSEFYTMYESQLLANKAFAWPTYNEMVNDPGYKEDICIRGKGLPREITKECMNIPREKVKEKINELERMGYHENILKFNQSMPDEKLVIQGEVVQTANISSLYTFHLKYSTIKKPMLQALAINSKNAKGLVAKEILKKTMDSSSYSDLEELLDLYPNAVIEFSTYKIPVGIIPNRNTVFWEVRNY